MRAEGVLFGVPADLDRLLALQKPFYNQSTEIHATLKESLGVGVLEQHLAGLNATPSGFVPGRPVLEVPGWRDRYTQPSATSNAVLSSLSRLRIFSGTSNPVGGN
jgi:hypothetical protein